MLLRSPLTLAAVLGLCAGLSTGPASTAPSEGVTIPPGHDDGLGCDYRHTAEALGRFGGFYTNQWTAGVVPYTFEDGSNTPVRSVRRGDLQFTIPFSGARLTSSVGFPRTFDVEDVIRVSGSQDNDFLDMVITNRIDTDGDPEAEVLEVDIPPPGVFTAEDARGDSIDVFTTESVSEVNRQRFVTATQEWEAVANVHFVPWTGQTNYVLVKNSDRNRVDGAGMNPGLNTLFMDAWWNQRTLMHELGHELGAKHEQERPDRNTYVTVDTSLVQDGREGNFTIDNSMTVYPPTIYDFASIMHYSDTAFLDPDTTGSTIVVNPPWNAEWQNLIGRIDSLSYWDEKTMSFLYPEPDWRFLDRGHAGTEDGAFLTPFANFDDAYLDVPWGGRMIVKLPGTYLEPGVYSRRMVIEAPVGGVFLRGGAAARPDAAEEEFGGSGTPLASPADTP